MDMKTTYSIKAEPRYRIIKTMEGENMGGVGFCGEFATEEAATFMVDMLRAADASAERAEKPEAHAAKPPPAVRVVVKTTYGEFEGSAHPATVMAAIRQMTGDRPFFLEGSDGNVLSVERCHMVGLYTTSVA